MKNPITFDNTFTHMDLHTHQSKLNIQHWITLVIVVNMATIITQPQHQSILKLESKSANCTCIYYPQELLQTFCTAHICIAWPQNDPDSLMTAEASFTRSMTMTRWSMSPYVLTGVWCGLSLSPGSELDWWVSLVHVHTVHTVLSLDRAASKHYTTHTHTSTRYLQEDYIKKYFHNIKSLMLKC